MGTMNLRTRFAAVASVLIGLLAVCFFIERPWYLSWGGSPDERTKPLVGDDIVAQPRSQGTRAITISAPAALVWGWVAQLGQDRAGFYSYEILEDLVGCEMPHLTRLDPTLQSWRPGDRLWMYPPSKIGGAGHAVFLAIEPGRALGFGTRQIGTPLTAPPDASWSFVVEPIDASSSRLLIRGRATGLLAPFASAFNLGIFEPVHFVMERKTMESIKALAEGRTTPRLLDDLQVLLWTLTFAAFVASLFTVLRGRQPQRRLVTLVAAGLLFQFLTFVQPSPLLGVPLVLALLAGVWLPVGLFRHQGPAIKVVHAAPAAPDHARAL